MNEKSVLFLLIRGKSCLYRLPMSVLTNKKNERNYLLYQYVCSRTDSWKKTHSYQIYILIVTFEMYFVLNKTFQHNTYHVNRY